MNEKMKSYNEMSNAVIEDTFDIENDTRKEKIDELLEELNNGKTDKKEAKESINADFFRDIVYESEQAKYTDEDIQFEQFNELREMRTKGKILEGRISSVEYSLDRLTVTAFVSRGKLRIGIPATEIIEKSSLNVNFFSADKHEQAERYYQMIRKRMGSKISFLLTDCRIEKFDEETGTYTYIINGSVLEANKLKRDFYFFDEEQRVKRGSIVQAKVLSYNEKIAVFSCCGCEIPMTIQDIQWREYIEDLRYEEDFGVGKTFDVSVYKLAIDKSEKKIIEFRVSRRFVGHDELKNALEFIKKGGSYLGQVIHIDPKTKRAMAYINNKTVQCYIPPQGMIMRQLYPGDNIIVTITKIDKEHCYVIGSAMEISIAE